MTDRILKTPALYSALAKGDIENAIVAATPGGIEAQEKAGQETLVQSTDMPLDLKPNRDAYEKLGFVFGEPVDELFVAASLPDGWLRRATEHPMWSEIVDGDGRVRAQIFYKAAFYDRKAHASLERRYKTTYDDSDADHYAIVVRDAGTVLKRFGEAERGDWKRLGEIEDAAEAWLTENYPDHMDATAYW